MRKTHRFVLFLVLLLVPLACDPLMVYDNYDSMDDGLWGWRDVPVFEVDMQDSVSLFDIYLQVRHSTSYPLSNLFMFVNLKGPSGQFRRDTVNLILAAPDGSWYGRGNGSMKEMRLVYRSGVRFAEPGSYSFFIEQAMRHEELPVKDLGLRIEKQKQ